MNENEFYTYGWNIGWEATLVEKKQDVIFALDVGTRKVTGLIATNNNGAIKIHEVVMKEHSERAMLDGQIHDIPLVAGVINEVKKNIENAANVKLTTASVAAAGRSLVTKKSFVEKELDYMPEIDEDTVMKLEYEAVHEAQKKINAKNIFDTAYHCVGYSVIKQYLDGVPIRNLIGQRGKKVSVEVIATFLPRVVVDSLKSVLKKSDLDMLSLTLEPIAALEIVVPQDMRNLNLSLVDIGAGTSDIAITAGGSVISYDMVPMAGDEITEGLCQELLLDFMAAERVKREIKNTDNIKVVSVLGEENTFTSEEILTIVQPVIDELAGKIADSILELNGKSPQAVFCVGGGSLTPGITEAIADKLNLTQARVVVKGKEMIDRLPKSDHSFHGPELVTPLGIVQTAQKREAIRFIKVELNNEEIQLTNFGNTTVLDVLLAAGVQPSHLYGKPGAGITVEVNGDLKTIKGSPGKLAAILINDKTATLDSLVTDSDKVTFEPATSGEKARGLVKELLSGENEISIFFNGKLKVIPPKMTLNGKPCNLETSLPDNGKIIYRARQQIKEVLAFLDIKSECLSDYPMTFNLNGQEERIDTGEKKIYLNGEFASLDTIVVDGDYLELKDEEINIYIANLLEKFKDDVEVIVNGEAIKIPCRYKITINSTDADEKHLVRAGDDIWIKTQKSSYIMADVLKELDFDSKPPPPGKRLSMKINSMDAKFTSPVSQGDLLEILWN